MEASDPSPWLLLAVFFVLALLSSSAEAETHYHEFIIEARPVARHCRTHDTITVNGQFPVPTLEVGNGDSVVVNVVNAAHWFLAPVLYIDSHFGWG